MPHRFLPSQFRGNLHPILGVFFLAVTPLALAVPSAWAETRTVTNSNDSGAGSLRAAVAAAGNSDAVDFASGVTAIYLTGGIDIAVGNLVITGISANPTSITANNSQIFTWSESAANGLVLNNLLLSEGENKTDTDNFGQNVAYGGALAATVPYGSDVAVGNIANTAWTGNAAAPTSSTAVYVDAYGGALSLHAELGASSVGETAHNIWSNNTALARTPSAHTSDARGGALSSFTQVGNATIGNMAESQWEANAVQAVAGEAVLLGYFSAVVQGGAAASSTRDGSSIVGDMRNTSWNANRAEATAGRVDSSGNAEATAFGGALSSAATTGNGHSATIGDIDQTSWSDNKINATAIGSGFNSSQAYGGALSSFGRNRTFPEESADADIALVGNIANSTWHANEAAAVATEGDAVVQVYGGALSVHAVGGHAVIGDMSYSIWEANAAMAEATGVTSNVGAYGGALSTFADSGNSTIGSISDSQWAGNSATANGQMANAYGGALSSVASNGDSVVGGISDSQWTGNSANANGQEAHAYGGALSSVADSGDSVVGDVSDSQWTGNSATANGQEAHAYGGALSSFAGDRSVINSIIDSSWTGNSSTAVGDVAETYGGALASDGRIGFITDTAWVDNETKATATALANAHGGALSARVAGDVQGTTWRGNRAVAVSSGQEAHASGGAGRVSAERIIDSSWQANIASATVTVDSAADNIQITASAEGGAAQSEANGDLIHTLWNENRAIATAETFTAGEGSQTIASARGGALASFSAGTVSNSIWTNNQAIAAAANDGAALEGEHAEHFNLEGMPDVPLTASSAYAYGGAWALGGVASSAIGAVTDSAWTGNTAAAAAQGINAFAGAYGGALYSTALTAPLTIRDSAFVGNKAFASAASATAAGGAIFIDTAVGDSSQGAASVVTLAAGNGAATIFQNNTVNVNETSLPSSIAFGRTLDGDSIVDAIFNIRPDAGGVVAMYDPVSVDLNNGHSFVMNVNSPGVFLWGGVNQADVAGDGDNTFNFDSGRVVLQPDFTLESATGNLVVNLTGGAAGIVLAPDLTDRDQSLAIFDSPAALSVAGGQVLIDPIYNGPYFSGSQSWLLTNASGSATASDFITTSTADFTSAIAWEDFNLYIILSNVSDSGSLLLADLSRDSSPNVQAAYVSGSLDAAWGIQQSLLDGSQRAAALHLVEASPRLFTGEPLVDQGLAALNVVGDLADRAWRSSRQSGMPYGSKIDPSNTLGYRPWVGYAWSSLTQDGANGYSQFKSAMNGGISGLSADIGSRASVSVYGAGASASTSAADLHSGINANAAQIGGLASYALLPQLQIGFESGYARLDNDAARSTPLGGYTSSFDQDVAFAGARLDFDLPLDLNTYLTLTPKLRYLRLSQDAVNETGDNPTWALHTGSASADSLISSLGASISHEFIFANGMGVSAWINAEWLHQAGDASLETVAQLGDHSQFFPLSSTVQDRDAAKLEASVASVLYSFYGGINIIAELEYSATRTNNSVDHVYHFGITTEF